MSHINRRNTEITPIKHRNIKYLTYIPTKNIAKWECGLQKDTSFSQGQLLPLWRAGQWESIVKKLMKGLRYGPSVIFAKCYNSGNFELTIRFLALHFFVDDKPHNSQC